MNKFNIAVSVALTTEKGLEKGKEVTARSIFGLSEDQERAFLVAVPLPLYHFLVKKYLRSLDGNIGVVDRAKRIAQSLSTCIEHEQINVVMEDELAGAVIHTMYDVSNE